MKKIITCLITTLLIISTTVLCSAAPELKAGSAILASLTGDQIIYSKNPDSRVAPAELTKLMTAYTTYKLYGMDAVFTVPENLGDYTYYADSSMKLKPGEQLKSSDLIYGMLVEQANDAAYTVALSYGGIDAFVGKMNEYAKELEMKNTVFKNVTGKEDSAQYTTANDLLKLYRAFYKDRKLYTVISTKSVVIPATNLSDERSYWTKNHLMSRFIYFDYIYDYATAGVSSSTQYGGYSVISSALKGEKEFVGIVLNSVKEEGINHAMIDAQNLFNYGFDELKTVDVVKQGGLLYEADVKNAKGMDTMLLVAGKSVKAQIDENDDVSSVQKQVVITKPIEAPVKKGDVLGTVIYTYNGNLVSEIQLIAENNVEKSMLKTVFNGIKWFLGLGFIKFIMIFALIFFIVVIAVSYIRANQRRKRRRNRRTNYRKF